MSGPFSWQPEGVGVDLQPWEVAALETLPGLLSSVGIVDPDPAARRLDPSPYPDQAEASEEFRRLMADETEKARLADRSAFEVSLQEAAHGLVLSEAEAGAWLRVIGEARLTLAARMGIEEDGWEDELPGEDQTVALLHYLGWIQQSLVETLEERLP